MQLISTSGIVRNERVAIETLIEGVQRWTSVD